MAITKNDSTFLFYSKSLGVSFDKTLMLGRLNLYATKNEIQEDINKFKNNLREISDVVFKDEYSEPIFEILGASVVDSMDFSDYEKATVIHDLNNPVPENLKKKYTAIVDGGTIEHVFNFPVAIKNCMEMLQVNGHYLGITPVNNMMGHGFYQFSPELYYNIFSESNGFAVKKMVIFTTDQKGRASDWYEVTDPAIVKNRITLVNSKPVFLMMVAQRISDVPVFATTPQQSDYQTTWLIRKSLDENKVPPNENRVKYWYRKAMPKPVKIFVRHVYDMFTKNVVNDENLGEINSDYFRKMNI